LGEIATEIEERARHLALSAAAPSEEVAALLEQAADRALARGAPAAAAELFELSIKLTPPGRDGDLARRKLETADMYFWSGALDQSSEILRSLLEGLPAGEGRADVLVRLARVAEDLETALELGEQARREAGGNSVLLARIHFLLAQGWPERGIEYALEHGRRALEHAERSEQRRLTVVVLARLSLYELWKGRTPVHLLERAVALESSTDDAPALGNAGTVAPWLMNVGGYASPRMPLALWRMYQGRLDDARALFEALLEQADAVGDHIAMLATRGRLVDAELRAGNWQQAALHAAAAFELSEQLGLKRDGGFSLYWRALVDGHFGLLAAARAEGELGARLAREAGERNTEVMNLGVLGFLELSLGNDAAALPHLRPLIEWLASRELGLATHPLAPYAIEALIASDELEEAAELITRFIGEASALESPWAVAIGVRCGGLQAAARGDVGSALTTLERALIYSEDQRWPFERARTLLALGRTQRRAKQKAAAKRTLEEALAILERLPAPLWVERVQDEIARIGLRRHPSADLTENEQRVAELAASGLTNREVAAQLFISPKTVEANLARVYRKLGIRSRAELGARLAKAGPEPAQT
jgi:DNA-binding CsgD family transcriptional regulator